MKIVEMNYTKKSTGEKTKRNVMLMHNTKEYIDTIDLTKLDEDDIRTVMSAQKDYEESLAPFMKHFRRFSKDSMEILKEDEVKVKS